MNTNTTETKTTDWSELKGKIKTRWGKFTDENIESLKGNMEQLPGRLQKLYGYAKEEADKESAEFKASLEATPAAKPVLVDSKAAAPQPAAKVA